MRKTLAILLMMSTSLVPTLAQRVLTLDSCRALALRNNKQLQAARVKQDVAANTRKAARTNFLPKVDAIGGYELMSKEVSLLNDDQKQALSGAFPDYRRLEACIAGLSPVTSVRRQAH